MSRVSAETLNPELFSDPRASAFIRGQINLVSENPRLILFPGLGADERMYEAQRAVFAGLEVPRWLDPRRGETLADFARRMVDRIDHRGPLFLGGSSFGGWWRWRRRDT